MNTPHEFIDAGISIIPVGKDKRPLIKTWNPYREALATHDRIDRWIEQYPDCRWGLLTGSISGNLFVVDFDDPGYYEREFADTWGKQTLVVKTPRGGYHVYFHIDPCPNNIMDWKDVHKIDTRGNGGYVLAHTISEGYHIINDMPIAKTTEQEIRDVFDVWKKFENVGGYDFDRIKAEVSVPDMVRHYMDGDVSSIRGKNDWALIKCPFHNDNKPSLSIHQNFFKCHGCDAKGSVIDYVSLRSGEDDIGMVVKRIERFTNKTFRLDPGKIVVPETHITDSANDWSNTERCMDTSYCDGFIRDYIDYAGTLTDAFKEYHYVSALMILSTMVERRKYIHIDRGKMYPNLYVFVLGLSTSSRKSASTNIMNNLIKSGGWSQYLPTSFSYEAFVEEMSDNPVRILVVDEAGSLLKNMAKKYASEVKDVLCHLYDGEDFYRKLRSKKDKNEFDIINPHLSIFLATVPDTLYANSDLGDTTSGWFARFLFVHPRYDRDRRPFELFDDDNATSEVNITKSMQTVDNWISHNLGATVFDAGAFEYYQKWQMRVDDDMIKQNNEHYNAVMGRMYGYVLKIAMLHAVSRMSNTITQHDIEKAVHDTETFFVPNSLDVMSEVEQRDADDITARKIATITRYLKKRGGKASRRELLNATKMTVKPFTDLTNTLLDSGLIRMVDGDEKGQKTTVVFYLQECL